MRTFGAKFYDGITSDGVDVVISLDGERISIAQLPDHESYPIAEVLISPRLGRTPRKLTLPDGAVIEPLDSSVLDEWERGFGRGRGTLWLDTLESTWLVAGVAALVLSLVVAAGLHWGIPLVAHVVAKAVPDEMAYDLGQGTLAILDRGMLEPTALPAERKAQLVAQFGKLEEAYEGLPLTLVFRRGVGPNAFALPDGTIVLTDELVQLAKDDREVLAVLAHEVGHVQHRHALRMALESSTVVVLVSSYLGDMTQLSTLSAALPAIVAQARYSRVHELEADDFALQYLDQAQLERRHYASILRSLMADSGKDPEHALKYLASHPPTEERIRRIEH